MRTDHRRDGGPRRFLIATAVAAHTQGPGWDRPGLEDARAQMIALFTEQFGYTLVDTLGMNPTSTQLLKALRNFCKSPDRRGDDVVALYFTGHGERLDATGEHVLVTSDTDPDDIEAAVPTADLARQMLFGTAVRRLLLMLDTCFSGQGGADFAAAVLTRFTNHWREDSGTGVVVFSSAQPSQLAQAGVFPQLFQTAVKSLAVAGYGHETLPLDALITAIGEDPNRTPGQDIEWTQVRVGGQIPPFLPNPRRDPQLTAVDLALQQASAWETHAKRRDIEFRTRLLVRAMGNYDNKGWWFCGRHAALTDITRWLDNPDPALPLLAVTGDPGSGKTAVLGLITTLTHPDYWRTVPIHALGLPAHAIPPTGAVDVAIYAQNLTVDEVRDGIAAAAHLSCATVGELIEALAGRARVLTVLIDAVDEAADSDRLTRKLLRPLIDHAGAHLRLLIGTRPYLLGNLGTGRDRAIDLDAPRYADRPALTTYTVRGLLEADPDTVYPSQEPEVIHAVADAVAEQADTSFLVARIVAATLSADPEIPDPADHAWRSSLPAVAGDAMHHDLRSRLREEADRARDLLRPLAFAQGQGLPWEDLWAPLASRIAGTSYSDHDLMWLRRHASSYVVEAIEAGRSAYRLYHQALAEHLTDNLDPDTVHARFVDVLCHRVPITADGHRDWSRAHPYTLRHLATHAAQAGLVDVLITDMDYLVHAEPATLLAALHTVTTDTARLTRAIYRCSAAHHRTLSPARRRQILAIDAARFHATAQQRQLNRTLTWPCRWATGNLTHSALRATITGHTDVVTAVACTSIDGHAVAVTGGRDNAVRVWDLGTGIERTVLTGHTDWVNAVACTSIDGCPVVVATSHDNTARVWDLSTGAEGAVLSGHTNSVTAVACANIEDQPVAVTTSHDNTVRVWDLNTGAERFVLSGHTNSVTAVACANIDDHAVAVTAGRDRTVRVWDLDTGAERAVLTGHTDWVSAVACTSIDGRPVAITTANDNTVRVWDLRTGAEYAVLTGHTNWASAVVCTSVDGRPVAVTTSYDYSVRVWDLGTGTERTALTGHTNWVSSVACTSIGGRPVAVTTSWDKTVRVWELDASRYERQITGHTNWVVGAAIESLSGSTVAVTTSRDRTVRVWDLGTGVERAVLTGHAHWVSAVACSSVDGCPVAVTTSRDDTVRVWDLRTGVERAVLIGHTHWVSAVACTSLDGRPVAVTTSRDRTARVWDLRTGVERAVLIGHTHSVSAVACTSVHGHPVAVTTSHDRTVGLWDLGTGERVVLTGHTQSVNAVACTSIDGQPCAVTTGHDRTVRVWDLGAGVERAVLTGHTQSVSAVACTSLDGRPVAVTASHDSTVRIWDLTTMSATTVINCPSPQPLVAVGPDAEILLGLGNDVAVLSRQP
ncbi:caspase family protein [Nocardia anaemiae]|uniref:caspase family protein n=1 Tax=Nocardia anaemiae TaxID=263910 RepID=UPI000AF738A1|nr:caspase family protein [Nocardia anaemiae]